MHAKRTTRNRITLPKAIVDAFPGVSHFDVTEENGRIVLAPMARSGANAVHDKLDRFDTTEQDIPDAV